VERRARSEGILATAADEPDGGKRCWEWAGDGLWDGASRRPTHHVREGRDINNGAVFRFARESTGFSLCYSVISTSRDSGFSHVISADRLQSKLPRLAGSWRIA
jgi:hypothetical protein